MQILNDFKLRLEIIYRISSFKYKNIHFRMDVFLYSYIQNRFTKNEDFLPSKAIRKSKLVFFMSFRYVKQSGKKESVSFKNFLLMVALVNFFLIHFRIASNKLI